MWKKILQPFIPTAGFYQPCRTTYVLKRKHPARLVKPLMRPESKLRKKHKIYEIVEDQKHVRKMLSLRLLKYVEDVGRPGDVVDIKETTGRFLVLTKAAEYAKTEAREAEAIVDETTFSSLYVGATIRDLSKYTLNISMNKENPWTLMPWHVRSAFRKAHVHVLDECITMPEDPITGPDLSIENKDFFITLTINKTEKIPVRCRIHHWATNEKDRLTPFPLHWKFPAPACLSPRDEEIAKTVPEIIPPPPESVLDPKAFKDLLIKKKSAQKLRNVGYQMNIEK